MKKILNVTVGAVVGLILLDFLTKLLILLQTPFPLELSGYYRRFYPGFYPVAEPLPFFHIILVWNNGVSFSMFANNTVWGRWALVLMSLAITAYIVLLLRREKERLNRIAFILIIAGALGNVFDRVRYGAVIDFLDVFVGQYHWPAFNLADIYICVGVGLIVLNSILKGRKRASGKKLQK